MEESIGDDFARVQGKASAGSSIRPHYTAEK